MEIVNLVLRYVNLLINIIVIIIQFRPILCCICKKISSCCQEHKEKRELAELGFTKEECQTELKSL